MRISDAIRSYIRWIQVSHMDDTISMRVSLLWSKVGRYRLIRDSHAVVCEMIQDRVGGILLLERTGRVFLPVLQALYKKHGLPFPVWKSFDPGLNPFGHTLEWNETLESIAKDFSGKGKIAVFDEYMVSGIRLKNTAAHLSNALGHPVKGYVLQHKEGAESITKDETEIFSAGHKFESEYLEIRNEFTEWIFLPDEPMRFRNSRVPMLAYRRIMKRLVEEVHQI